MLGIEDKCAWCGSSVLIFELPLVALMVDGLHAVFSCAWLLEERFAVEIFDRKSSKLYELLRHSPLLVFFRRHFN